MLIVGVFVYNDIVIMPLARKFLLSPKETVEVVHHENKPLLQS